MRPGDSDFEFVVTGSNDNLIHLIFAETDNLVHTFSGHEGLLTSFGWRLDVWLFWLKDLMCVQIYKN